MIINKNYINMFENVEAILFDMDGTLVDSMWIWGAIDIEYLGKFGLECPDTLRKDIEGLSVNDVARYFVTHFDIPENEKEMINSWNNMAYDKYINEVFVKKGGMELLDYCKNNNIKIGICSSNTRHLIDSVLKARTIYDRFSVIISGEDVEKGKPSPEVYLKASDYLNIDPHKCLVFEDLVPGIKAGKNAGMRVCAIDDEYSADERQLKLEAADYFITDFSDLWEI